MTRAFFLTTMSVGAVALSLTLTAAQAQDKPSDADRDFIKSAADSNLAEIATGKAAAKSDNPAIRDFGNQMIQEHGQANDELASLAQSKGVTPPDSASLGSQAKNALMNMMPGKTFDKQYVSSQLDDHHETLQLLQQQAQSGQDPELKAYARQSIPMVQKHIDELEALQKRPELQ